MSLLHEDETFSTRGGNSTGSPLRIAMVAPPWFDLPPRGYGGTEHVVAALVDQLVARGHEVSLIGAGRNATAANAYYPVFDRAPSERLGSPMPEVIAAAEAARVLEGLDVDIVHDHSLAGPLLARRRSVPTVATVHGPSTGDNGAYFERLGRTVDVVAISESQRRLNPRLNWAGMVHNAVDVASFDYSDDKDDYVLWLGRFTPDKGPDIAIDAALEAGFRIVLAGKLNEDQERAYFADAVAPRLGPRAEFVGEADGRLKRQLLSRARCLAMPIRWDEPFGIVMIEALASGTPVVALRRGSVPELVDDGSTGVLVRRCGDFPAALGRADAIRPEECRRQALARFDLPVMGAGYDAVYRMLVEGGRSIRTLLRGHG